MVYNIWLLTTFFYLLFARYEVMVLLTEFKRCHCLKIGGFGANVVGRVITDPLNVWCFHVSARRGHWGSFYPILNKSPISIITTPAGIVSSKGLGLYGRNCSWFGFNKVVWGCWGGERWEHTCVHGWAAAEGDKFCQNGVGEQRSSPTPGQHFCSWVEHLAW